MPAAIGVAYDVPPPPRPQFTGFPWHAIPPWFGSVKQIRYWCFHSHPSEANMDTSGTSRTPSDGIPKSAWYEGLRHPAHVPLTTPLIDGVPVAQPLGPPSPPPVPM